ncbi:hypothetical protein TRABTM_A_00110 [secondary endosymbiont of Trabutina mannipara]|uniref:Uncharacterized protein n=1 Tax=secondary endosymbiont of Trabutina mannipara TaxID=1835721 RepID=A0A1C3L3R7_9ENTR|nr:hypothetical protein TRABTM_A_00110 [secondary endosymbiont of Trabutina mannipara]
MIPSGRITLYIPLIEIIFLKSYFKKAALPSLSCTLFIHLYEVNNQK